MISFLCVIEGETNAKPGNFSPEPSLRKKISCSMYFFVLCEQIYGADSILKPVKNYLQVLRYYCVFVPTAVIFSLKIKRRTNKLIWTTIETQLAGLFVSNRKSEWFIKWKNRLSWYCKLQRYLIVVGNP